MAAAFKAKGTFASGSGNITPGMPAGSVHNQDFLLMFVSSANQAASAPAGWRAIPAVSGSPFRGTAGAAGGVRLDIFALDDGVSGYRMFQTGDSAPTVTDTGDYTTAIIQSYSDVDPTTPFDGAQPIASNAAASTTLTLPGITTQTANALVVQAAALDRDAASTTTVTGPHANANLTGEAERHDQTVSTNTGGGLWIGDGAMATAGATGNSTATQTSNAFVCITLSLRSAPPSPWPVLKPDFAYEINTETVAKPANVNEGDLMIAFPVTYDNPTDWASAPPTGWTEFAEDAFTGASNNAKSWVLWKIAGASEPADYTFDFNPNQWTNPFIVVIEAGTFDPANPLAAAQSFNSDTVTTRTATGVTTPRDDCLLLLHSIGSNADISAPPSGMSELFIIESGTSGIFYEVRESAGATGNRTHTQTITEFWGMRLVVVQPPAGAPAATPRFQAFAFG